MIVNVAEILKVFGAKTAVDGMIDFDNADFMGEHFVFTEPMSVKGSIINSGKTLELNAEASARVKVHCARCGNELTESVRFTVKEFLRQSDGEIKGDEDMIYFDGTQIVLDDIILNAFFMNVPTKYLCKEDCKGLCPHCGKNLNDGACSCEQSQEIDPRWASLAQMMKNMPKD